MHAIHTYILKKEELASDTKFIDLDVDGLIMTVIEPVTKDRSLYIEVQTDYFGGGGEQHCWSHLNGVVTELESINDGLKLLGVKRSANDEFDVVGLGKYRDVRDIFPEDFKHESENESENESDMEEFHKTKPFVAYPAETVISILANYMQQEENKNVHSMGLTTEEAERAAEKWLVKNVEGFSK